MCTIYEVGEAEGQVFIVMEHVEGRPLNALLSEPRPTETVVRYGIQIADALAHAHDRGIVHRDLKTSNVMLTPDGRIKVLDFGLAKRLPTEDLSEQPTRSGDSLTEAGQIVGTLHYLAPEVLRGQPADVRTDVWALGVLLCELATGVAAVRGEHSFRAHTRDPRGRAHGPLGDRAVRAARGHPALSGKEPSQRYQSAREVRAALEAIQSGSFVPEKPFRPWPLWGAAAALVLVSVAAALRFYVAPGRGIDSIAVLPFANGGGNPDTEYLSDGITESVIGSLSRLSGLRVIAFASVARYKGRPIDPQQVVRELGVSAILTGRLTQRSDGLSISAELVNASDSSRLWGDQYETPMSGLSLVQDRISSSIADTLHLRSSLEERRRGHRDASSPEAYDLYLKGRYYWNKFTAEGYEQSLAFYGRAIEKDPDYAPAYGGIARTYGAMTWDGLLRPRDGYSQVEAAVAKALQLDDTLANPHVALAILKLARDWDWRAAEKEYQRAVALGHHDSMYPRFLRAMGRWDEALAEMKRVRETDPLSIATNEGLGTTYYWARRYDEAIAQFQKTLEIEPNSVSTHDLLADVYARKGMYKEAIAEMKEVFVLNGDKESADGLERDFETVGFEPVMRQQNQLWLDYLKEKAKTAYVSPLSFAVAYTKLGEKEEAFAWLNKAAAERAPWVTYIKTDPVFDNLRSDPRFDELVKLIGLP